LRAHGEFRNLDLWFSKPPLYLWATYAFETKLSRYEVSLHHRIKSRSHYI